jgi:chromosome segregation ATPase
MFRKEQLIFVTLLAGCTTVANPPQEVIEPIEPVQVTVIEDNSLLDAINSTLEGADEILDQIVENKADTKNKISNLERTHRNDMNLISNLQSQCTEKDSIIGDYTLHHELLYKELETAEAKLAAAVHKCNNECTPAIHNLTEEIKYLKAYVDSLAAQLNYTDSLILTNKKLTKVYEAD